jgi:predicted PurR-regulated permease PerM
VTLSQNEVAGDEQATLSVVAVERPVLPASVRVAIVGIFLILLVAALYLARAFVLPLVLAILLALTAAPLVRRLARFGIPPAVTAILLVAGMGAVAAGGAALLREPIADMVTHAPDVIRTVRDKLDVLREPFAALSQASREVTEATTPAEPVTPGKETVTVVDRQPSLLDWLIATLADAGSTIVATLLLAPFLIASNEALKLKLIRAVPLLSAKKKSLRVLRDIEERVSRFLVTAGMLNTGLGILVGSAMAILGMPNPILWGVGAGLLNFIPYIGPATGIGLAAAVSLTIHDDLPTALLPPLVYAALNALEAGLVTPMVMGRRLSLSIVAILLSVALTTWMWGIIGTVIGVPILVVIKVFCEEFPSLAHVGLFISAESEPIEESEETAAANGNGGVNHAPPAGASPAPAPAKAAAPALAGASRARAQAVRARL